MQMLGISLSGMKSRVQRGRAQLREAVDECCSIGLDARGHVVSCEARPEGAFRVVHARVGGEQMVKSTTPLARCEGTLWVPPWRRTTTGTRTTSRACARSP